MTTTRVVDWIDGAINLRDFGGYRTTHGRLVRSGVLYRSGNTHEISSEGLAHLAQRLGIRTVVDLRSDGERSRGLSAFEAHGIHNVHEPLEPGVGVDPTLPRASLTRSMADGTFDWAEMYWNLLRLNADRFARLLALLAQPATLPVLVHCAGGRDRTGVSVALIQATIGVRVEDIAADYALSSQLLELGAPRPEFDRLFGGIEDIPRAEIVRAMTTHPSTMHALFDRINREYGSVDGLLDQLGVSTELRAELRAVLTQPD